MGYLEQIVRDNTLPSITWNELEKIPCNTWKKEASQPCITPNEERLSVLPSMAQLSALRDRVLSELKLGKQAPRYKAAQKALDSFIAQLTSSRKEQ